MKSSDLAHTLLSYLGGQGAPQRNNGAYQHFCPQREPPEPTPLHLCCEVRQFSSSLYDLTVPSVEFRASGFVSKWFLCLHYQQTFVFLVCKPHCFHSHVLWGLLFPGLRYWVGIPGNGLRPLTSLRDLSRQYIPPILLFSFSSYVLFYFFNKINFKNAILILSSTL